MSSLPAGYDAVPLDARTPTTVVDIDVVHLFLAIALALVLYHYLTDVSRRGQRDAAAGTPTSGGRRRHGVVGVAAAAAASVVQGVHPRPLPVTLYRGKDSEEAPECAVCLAELSDGEAARFLPKCGHGFHAECVGLWLRSHPTCPLCRVEVDAFSPLVLPPLPPEPANYPTNLPADALFWGSQNEVALATSTARTIGAVGRPSSSAAVAAELVIEVLQETTPRPAMAPREDDAAKSRGLQRLRSLWSRGRRHEVAASSTRSCGRATASA